jgi:HTH-type transcriptional regulator/antitoxin HigA
MEVKAIRTDADYRDALRDVSALIDLNPERDSPDGDRLDVLATLVQAYEAKHYPIDPPDPIEAIKFRMEQSGMGVKDLVPYIGPLNRVYEVLARKRPLTLRMIRRLLTLGIPASSLVGQPEPVAA